MQSMKSSLVKTDTCRAVYFNEYNKIVQISNREIDRKELFAWFEIEDVMGLLDGSMKMSDYVIKRTSNPLVFEIVKSKVDIKRRSKNNQLHKIESNESPDIMVSMKDDILSISCSDKLKNKLELNEGQDITVAGKSHHVFFVTHKDRPDFLIQTITVPFSELLTTGKNVKVEYNKYNVSVYTQKYFDNYSWR